MGLAVAKQWAEETFCKSKVVPIRLPKSPDSTAKVIESVDGQAKIPTIGNVTNCDNQEMQPPNQRIAWDDPSSAVPQIISCCKKQITDQLSDQRPKSAEKDADDTKVNDSGWNIENLDASKVVSAISPSVPWLLQPDAPPATNNENDKNTPSPAI